MAQEISSDLQDHSESSVRHEVNTGTDIPAASEEETIVINVGGFRHITQLSTLTKRPGSKLAKLADMHRTSQNQNEEYFFDRHPGVFNNILEFYRCGELHRPHDVCPTVVHRELAFWLVDDNRIERCCWLNYCNTLDMQGDMAALDLNLETVYSERKLATLTGWRRHRELMKQLLTECRTSRFATAYFVVFFIFVCVSVVVYCTETVPGAFQIKFENMTMCPIRVFDKDLEVYIIIPHISLRILNIVCNVYFTADFIARLACTSDIVSFFCRRLTAVDILALLHFYFLPLLDLNEQAVCMSGHFAAHRFADVIRITSLFRTVHVLRQFQPFVLIVWAMNVSKFFIAVLLVVSAVSVLTSGALMFFAETIGFEDMSLGKPDIFMTIPMSMIWAVQTQWRIHFTEAIPITIFGATIATVCAVGGLLLLLTTVPMICISFNEVYVHHRTRDRAKRNSDTKRQLTEEAVLDTSPTTPDPIVNS